MSDVLIVVPCFNEENRLESGVNMIDSFLRRNSLDYRVVISNNNSTDGTERIAKDLCGRLGFVYHEVNERGKGACVRNTWLDFDSEIYAFMDADISVDLEVLPKMVEGMKDNDIVIGSRYLPDSKCVRSLGRRLISTAYVKTFNSFFHTGLRDIQCGMKMINNNVRDNIVSKLNCNDFFFDGELIVKALKEGYKILEVPVNWQEKEGSKVNFFKDPLYFLNGIRKLYFEVNK